MKNVSFIFLGILLTNSLYSQINVAAKPTQFGKITFVKKTDNSPANNFLWDEVEPFVNGFCKVYNNGFWTHVNADGIPVSTNNYDAVRNFYNHKAAVNKNNKWGIIDEKGTLIIPIEYDVLFDYKSSVTAGFKNNIWYLINKQGNVLKQLDIDVFYGFNNDTAVITQRGSKGKINIKGELISIEPATASFTNRTPKLRSVASAPCPPNISFENGNFTNWNCFIGSVAAAGTNNVITVGPSIPLATRHEVYAATSSLDAYGLFNTNPPDGSGFAVKLGNTINGSKAERISYQITVPAGSTDASITYRYAVIFQDPGHFNYQQPRFSAKLKDVATNTYLPCASYEYISDSTLPGFFNSPIDDSVKCKAWAPVFINLSAYAGRTLVLEFTTADCTRGAHWGYAYVDVGDCNITADISYQCNPSVATVNAPPGFEFYNWWNNDYTAIVATGQFATITPIPPLNSMLHVEVIPFNGYGCKDTLDVPVTNGYTIADAGPDKSICAGNNTQIGSSFTPGNIYSWSPASFLSSTNTATTTANPPVTTTYYLTVSNPLINCPKTDTVIVTVNQKPIPAFVLPANQCLSTNNFTFNNTSLLADTYLWYFGDGTTSSQPNPTHTYSTSGAYTVKLIATNNNGCKDSISQNLTVFQQPEAAFTPPLNQCKFNNSFSFINNSSGAANYLWYFGDGNTSNAANPTHTYAIEGNYVVKLIATTINGCKDSTIHNISVFPQPVPAFITPPNQCIFNNNFTFTNSSNGATNYVWHFGDGSTSNQTNPTHSYVTAGVYSIKLIAENNNGCKDSVSSSITVFSKPIPSFIPPGNQCVSLNNFIFNNTSSNSTIYLWQFGDGTQSTSINPSHTYNTSGVYNVQLIVTNSNGCKDSVAHPLTVYAKPVAVFTPPAPQCIYNNNFSFTHNSIGANSCIWSFGDGSTSILTNPNKQYSNAGTYNVKLLITSVNGCKDSITYPVTVFAKPVPVFITPPNQCISNNSFTFTNTSTGAANSLWSFGDGTTSLNNSPVHTYSLPGNYTVQLIVTTSNGCKDSIANTISVFSQPVAAFSPPINQCISNNNFSFTSNSNSNLAHYWNFGDGTSSTDINATHQYSAAGSFTVKLIVTNSFGCKDSVAYPISVFAKPIPSFTPPPNQCIQNNSFDFVNQSTGVSTYLWHFGDGSTSTLSNPLHSYTTAANYIVQLIVTSANGCIDSTSHTISVYNKPIAAFVAPAPQCVFNNNFYFTNSAVGATNFLWNFGDGTFSNLPNGYHSYDTAGNYTVKLLVSNSYGCIDSLSNPVIVFAKPKAIFEQPLPQCLANNNIVFSNNSALAASSYWHLGDGSFSNEFNPSHTYNQAGNYIVKLITTSVNGCKDSTERTININAQPAVNSQSSYTICSGTSVPLSASGGQTYVWFPADGLSCTNCPNPTANPTTSTQYTVTAFSPSGCSNNKVVQINVNQPININPSPDKAVCGKSVTTLFASGASSYKWSPAAGLSNTEIPNPIASPDTTTLYKVIGYDSNNCFTDTAFVKITVHPFPAIELGANVTLATGTLYPIQPQIISGPITSWQWSPPVNLSCFNCPKPIATVKNDITYVASVKNIFGCTAYDSLRIFTLCKGSQVFVPNAFTPDADGRNDLLMVRSQGIHAIKAFKIYSRWGELIFEKYNFPPNNPAYGWDGKIRGKLGSAEVYVYTLEVICDNAQHFIFKGNISILN